MIRMIALAALATAAMTASSFAAEPIVGTWKRPNGTVIKYAGSGPFCGTVQTGEYKGKSIGCMNGRRQDLQRQGHRQCDDVEVVWLRRRRTHLQERNPEAHVIFLRHKA
jgi:uncharacterized protein (DUF2147 family)